MMDKHNNNDKRITNDSNVNINEFSYFKAYLLVMNLLLHKHSYTRPCHCVLERSFKLFLLKG